MIERRIVMGTSVGVDAAAGTADVFAWLDWVDATFSPYRSQSEISRIAEGTLASAEAHPLVRHVLGRCESLRERTGGVFDVGATGRLDPSGFVKGWAVERAAALLECAGVHDYLLDAGGDLRMRGRPRRVGIRHPQRRDRVAAVLTIHDGAVATSAGYERGLHVVDGRTGAAPTGVASVTVTGADLALADAYATTAYAMGTAGPAWTLGLEPGYEALTILDDTQVLATPGWPGEI